MPTAAFNDAAASQTPRVSSIDALRGFVMFTMIFVNDLAGAGKVVPDSMVHFSDRHRGGSGMTFVDLVFPAFLFIVGMSIPFALGRRLEKGESWIKIAGHVALRMLSLLFIGILMVHETPDTKALGWSGNWWCVAMYGSAMAAFCSISPPAANWTGWKTLSRCVRVAGFLALVWLAFAFRDAKGQAIITLAPFSLDTRWYGILGLIGWAYGVTSVIYLVFRNNRTAILGSMVLLLCLFAAARTGTFDNSWLNRIVGIGSTLGSLPAIATGGLLLASMLLAPEAASLRARTVFTSWFVIGCVVGALLLNRLYGISKNQATPSWCLWACAITATLWYGFYLLADVRAGGGFTRILVLAGQNVLLAYLISEMLPGLLEALHLGEWYANLATNLPQAVTRSALCGVLVLSASVGLNRLGFRLKL
jgi:heparan-alpha-glucosaminide N-acetyltransferase